MPRSCRVTAHRRQSPADRDRRAARGARRRSRPFRRRLPARAAPEAHPAPPCLLERRVERLPLDPRRRWRPPRLEAPRAAPGAILPTATPGDAATPVEHVRILAERAGRRAASAGAAAASAACGRCPRRARRAPAATTPRTASPASGPDATISMRVAASDLEPHDADHAPRVHLVAAPPQPDVRVELLRAAGEDRGRPRMQAGRIRDDERPGTDELADGAGPAPAAQPSTA